MPNELTFFSGLLNSTTLVKFATGLLKEKFSQSPYEVNTLQTLIAVHHRTVNDFSVACRTFAIHFSLEPSFTKIIYLARRVENSEKNVEISTFICRSFLPRPSKFN